LDFGGTRLEGEQRRPDTEKLHILYSSPNIIRVIKSRKMRWASMWHLWWRGELLTGVWLGDLMERGQKELGIDGNIILKLIFKKLDGVMDWINLAQSRNRWQAVVNVLKKVRFP